MLIQLIIVLIVIGLVLWIIESVLPLDATIKKLIQVVLVVVALLFVLQAFGIVGAVNHGRSLW